MKVFIYQERSDFVSRRYCVTEFRIIKQSLPWGIVTSQRKVYSPFFFNEKLYQAFHTCIRCRIIRSLSEISLNLKTSFGNNTIFLIIFFILCEIGWKMLFPTMDRTYRSEWHGLRLWPPWSPDLTSCDFFLWGYVKDRVCLPSLPVDLPDMKRIAAAIESITPDMLNNVWEKFDYRLDVCHVTNGAHIEHL